MSSTPISIREKQVFLDILILAQPSGGAFDLKIRHLLINVAFTFDFRRLDSHIVGRGSNLADTLIQVVLLRPLRRTLLERNEYANIGYLSDFSLMF